LPDQQPDLIKLLARKAKAHHLYGLWAFILGIGMDFLGKLQKFFNNTAERTLKPIAIGRKNWLFVGSKQDGHLAAILFSLVQTCKRLEVEPWAYLKDLFTRLPLLGEKPSVTELDRLLPDNWLKEHPEHVWRINQIRREEDKNAVIEIKDRQTRRKIDVYTTGRIRY
jgi:transposase